MKSLKSIITEWFDKIYIDTQYCSSMIKMTYNKMTDIQAQINRSDELKLSTIAGQAKTIEEQHKLIEALINGEAGKSDCELFVFKTYRDKHPIVYSDGKQIDTSYAGHVDISWYYGEATEITVEC